MNNRLKLRVWDKVNNKFINPFRFEYDNYYKDTGMVLLDFNGKIRIADYSSGNGDNSASSVYSEINNPDNYVIQQYTGLNDKDNNAIFDGDLVELHTAANDHAKNLKDNHYGLYEIYWDRKYKLKEIKPNWFLKVIDNDFASFNIMKVVGNVFENPELLKTI